MMAVWHSSCTLVSINMVVKCTFYCLIVCKILCIMEIFSLQAGVCMSATEMEITAILQTHVVQKRALLFYLTRMTNTACGVLLSVQMHLEGSRIMQANNETAFNYFKKSSDKVCSWLFVIHVVSMFQSKVYKSVVLRYHYCSYVV